MNNVFYATSMTVTINGEPIIPIDIRNTSFSGVSAEFTIKSSKWHPKYKHMNHKKSRIRKKYWDKFTRDLSK
jgi:hypothetical protein